MRNFLVVLTLFFVSFADAQNKEVYSLEFHSWIGATDNNHYEMALIVLQLDPYYLGELDNTGEFDAQVRVKYTVEGVEKIVEFNAHVKASYLDNQNDKQVQNSNFYSMIVDGYPPVKLIKGDGGYIPDNFVFSGVIKDNLTYPISAFHIDDAGFLEENIRYALVNTDYFKTADEGRAKIKKFFSPADAMYRELMLYIANFD
ncbi:hypothetical protein [Confluentibacter lentus]|uniref:hypothetical protein n=1 Tax=Confluentibacter lentus TaxID=1699412 RepID=UPI000C2915AA|nr:hypothetical protein [Confluentibacter lentus]